MSVSKKDFVAIAAILKEARKEQRNGAFSVFILDRLETRLADYFEAENGMFDRVRFFNACIED